MRIAVYGAGGYTGRPAAAEVVDAQADLVPAGRGVERLRTTAQGLRLTGRDTRTAGVDDPSALAKAFAGCAGPFTLHGEPVVRVEPLWSVEEN